MTRLRLFARWLFAFVARGGSIGRLTVVLSPWGRAERFSLSEPNEAAGDDDGLRDSVAGVARFGQRETSVLGRGLCRRAMVIVVAFPFVRAAVNGRQVKRRRVDQGSRM